MIGFLAAIKGFSISGGQKVIAFDLQSRLLGEEFSLN
jgi:hypothetical protein